MKVPEYQERISTVTPETRAPAMPQISMPSVIPEAFGKSVAEAYENLGRVGEKIAGHLTRMAFDEQDRVRLEKETAFMQDWQNRLTNQEKGLLLRTLGSADGVTLEAKLAQKKIREETLKGLSKYQIDKLAPFIDRHFLSIENQLITHEQNQHEENEKNSVNSNLDQIYLDSSTIRTGEELNKTIDSAQSSVAWYLNRFDKATQKVKNEEIASKIVEAATLSTLQNTGDLTLSQSFLDNAKSKIAQSTYDEIKEKLIKGYDVMKLQTEKLKLENKISDRFNYLNLIANGKLDWQNSPEVIRNIAIKDPTLAESMQKVIDSQGEYFPEEADNEAYADLTKNVFTAGSKEEISDFLIEALNTPTKEISKDRLAILVSAAQERAKSLPVSENDEPTALSPKQNEIDAGVKSIINTKNKQFSIGDMIVNFFKGIISGKSVQDAHTEAVKSEINRTNPLSVKYKVGDIITNSKGESAEIVGFNDNGSPMLKRKISGKQSSNIK